MSRRRHLILACGISVISLLLVVFVARHDLRRDLTSQGLYTLHPRTVEALEALASSGERVEIDVYLSGDLPPRLEQGSRRQRDLLEEYAALAGEAQLGYRVHEIVSLDGARADEAKAQGCTEVAIGARQRGAVSVRAIFKCVVFRRGERRHVISNLPLDGGEAERDSLEFVLTRGLVTLTRGRARKIAFAQGLGGPADLPRFIEGVTEVFEELYGGGVEPIGLDLSNAQAASQLDASQLDALILLDPGKRVDDTVKVAIDRYLCAGGAVGWYQSATTPDERLIRELVEGLGPTGRVPDVRRVVDTGLEDLFAHHGITHRRDLVLDPEHAVEVELETLSGAVVAENPAIFQANRIDRDAGVSFLDDLSFVIWPAPSSLQLSARRDGVKISALVRTAPSAERYEEPVLTRNYEAMKAPGGPHEQGSHVLMALAQGKFAPRHAPDAVAGECRATGRLLVAGSGDFLIPARRFGYTEEFADQGQRLFFESVEWLVQGGEDGLLALRDRRLPPSLGEVDRTTRLRVQLLNIAFVPMMFLFLVYACSLWRGARRDRLMARMTRREK